MRVLVTGASGKAGKYVVRDLVEAGHDVLATDIAPGLPDCPAPFIRADLTDYGDAVELLDGMEAVAHLANIPAPELFTPAHTLNTNNAMNSNVFLAAAQLRAAPGGVGLQRDHTGTALRRAAARTRRSTRRTSPSRPRPTRCRRCWPRRWPSRSRAGRASRSRRCGCRTSSSPATTRSSPATRTTRDCGNGTCGATSTPATPPSAFRCALEADTTGAVSAIVANDDTVMDGSSADLLREVFPGVELTREVGEHQTLLANDRAKSCSAGSRRTPGATRSS